MYLSKSYISTARPGIDIQNQLPSKLLKIQGYTYKMNNDFKNQMIIFHLLLQHHQGNNNTFKSNVLQS